MSLDHISTDTLQSRRERLLAARHRDPHLAAERRAARYDDALGQIDRELVSRLDAPARHPLVSGLQAYLIIGNLIAAAYAALG